MTPRKFTAEFSKSEATPFFFLEENPGKKLSVPFKKDNFKGAVIHPMSLKGH
jgi:hypothetical protein